MMMKRIDCIDRLRIGIGILGAILFFNGCAHGQLEYADPHPENTQIKQEREFRVLSPILTKYAPFYRESTWKNLISLPDGTRLLIPSRAYPNEVYIRDNFWGALGLENNQISQEGFRFFSKYQLENGAIPTYVSLSDRTAKSHEDESTLLYLIWAGTLHRANVALDTSHIEKALSFVMERSPHQWYISPAGHFRYWADTVSLSSTDVISYNQGLLVLALRFVQEIRPDLVPQEAIDRAEKNYRSLFRKDLGFMPLSRHTTYQDISALFPEILTRLYFRKGILSNDAVLQSIDHSIIFASIKDQEGHIVGIKVIAHSNGSFLKQKAFGVPELNHPGKYHNGGYWPLFTQGALSFGYQISGDEKYIKIAEELVYEELASDFESKEYISLEPGKEGTHEQFRNNYSWNAFIPIMLRWAEMI